MSMKTIFIYGSVGIQIIGWIAAVIGLSMSTSFCAQNKETTSNIIGLWGLGPNPFNSPPSAYDCGIQYSWYWWVIALQFACIVFALTAGSKNAWTSVASFYAIATALWSIYCYALVVQTYQYQKSSYGTTWGPSYAVNAAGAVAVSTANFFYILARGLDDDTGDNANDEKKEMKNPTAASQV